MFRKILFVFVKLFGKRRHILVYLPVIAWILMASASCLWFAEFVTKFLMPPPPPDQNLEHFRRNRSLQHYLDNINLLIEPSTTPCTGPDEIQVVALVTTAPSRFDHRQAIRETWAKHQPTYFILGLEGDDVDEQLVDIYVEAKQYGDMLVWDFKDHYQNLTLKTAVMMQWTVDKCSQAQFMFKIDDDVLLNPWQLKNVLRDNEDAKLVGYRNINTTVHRDEYTRWFTPRWLFPEDVIPEYLAGPGYLVNTDYLKDIIKAAKTVPLINLEDVYFTYLVAKKKLGFELRHDARVSPWKPLAPLGCGYWRRAAAHGLSAAELLRAWRDLQRTAADNSTCQYYDTLGKFLVF